jgi:hypothetical protein
MTAKTGGGSSKGRAAAPGRTASPKKGGGRARPKVDHPVAQSEALNPDVRRMVARYLREDMVAVLTICDRPTAPSMTLRQIPATDAVFPRSTRVALSDRVVQTWSELEVAVKDAERPPMDITDGARWMSRVLLHGTDALLVATADLVECKDLRVSGNSPLTAIGNMFSVALRRSLLLAALEFHKWKLAKVADDLRLGGTGNLLRTIRDLGLDGELAQARVKGLVRRGGDRTKKNSE